jgi:hypothetical protein
MTMLLERAATRNVAESFAFGPGVRDALPRFRTRCSVVRLATVDNEVLGIARWSTLAEAWAEHGSELGRRWSENPVVTVGATDDPGLVLATRTPVVVFGIDNARHAFARAVIDAVRASCDCVLVADLGGHAGAPAYADITTFGHDRERGAALLDLLSAPKAR